MCPQKRKGIIIIILIFFYMVLTSFWGPQEYLQDAPSQMAKSIWFTQASSEELFILMDFILLFSIHS